MRLKRAGVYKTKGPDFVKRRTTKAPKPKRQGGFKLSSSQDLFHDFPQVKAQFKVRFSLLGGKNKAHITKIGSIRNQSLSSITKVIRTKNLIRK